LFFAEFVGLFHAYRPQAFVAGAEPSAADKDFDELDASGCANCRFGGAHIVSPHCACWAAYAQCSSRTEFVQPTSAYLLNFFV
jgi:hypothetical protein